VDFSELTAAREIEQRRLTMLARQRRSVSCLYEGQAAEDEKARLERLTVLTEALIEEYSDRILDTWRMGSRPTLEPH
jgi:hypothetical protein